MFKQSYLTSERKMSYLGRYLVNNILRKNSNFKIFERKLGLASKYRLCAVVGGSSSILCNKANIDIRIEIEKPTHNLVFNIHNECRSVDPNKLRSYAINLSLNKVIYVIFYNIF